MTGALQFYREFGSRLLDVSGHRSFGIQFTNVELMTLGMLWPMTLTRIG